MGKRKRIQVGELSTLINEDELNALIEQQKNKFERSKSNHGEVVQDIMKENDCSWTEAKQIYKFRKVREGIKREIDLLTYSHS